MAGLFRRGLGFRYAMRNVLHYRTKYSIAFLLIAAFAACLALSLFAFNGFWKQAAVFARAQGDMTIWVYSPSLDWLWSKKGEHGEAPSRSLEREAKAFIMGELDAERVVATSYTGGDLYAPTGSWNVGATILERARQLADVDLAEGKDPSDGEILVSASLRPTVKLGDGLTFVFKNTDTIINSLTFRVSGFFLPTSDSSSLVYMTQDQFDKLDENRVPDQYYVFFKGMGGKRAFLDRIAGTRAFASFRSFLVKQSGGSYTVNSGYYTAEGRYNQSKEIINLFEAIISIFLVALVVVALATIVNVLFITVVDRIKIVGTFMAYGMTRGQAILLLSTEMLVFSFAACTVGILVALAAVGPLSGIKFTADNWTIAVILGGKRSLTIIPALWAIGATYLVGMILPFATATLSVARMLRGEVVGLLHYAK
jgi:hypothetical protein